MAFTLMLAPSVFRRAATRAQCRPLIDAIIAENEKIRAAFFCPGHRRGVGAPASAKDLIGEAAYQTDLPELPSLDNLFAPSGAIRDAEHAAASAFGAGRTFFLVNGSTSGIIAAVVAVVKGKRRKIILPRGIHQSAVHALVISGAEAVFVNAIYDDIDDLLHGVTVEEISRAIEQHSEQVAAVLVVSPTYHGVTSDILGLAEAAHAAGAYLIVDEAHGAHCTFHPDLPPSALSQNADVAVQSTHKTLGSLTQSAMLHISKDTRLQESDVQSALQLVQSTSPSYLLLASLDAARQDVALNGRSSLETALLLARDATQRLESIDNLRVLRKPAEMVAIDPTRITVLLDELDCSGYTVDEELIDEYGVYAELPADMHITFIISIGNTKADVELLVSAMTAIAGKHAKAAKRRGVDDQIRKQPVFGEEVLSVRDAFLAEKELVPLQKSAQRICGSAVCPYPPGIPVLLPGERVTPACIEYLQRVIELGAEVSGCDNDRNIVCVAED
eukprot:Plantae.Rhodophyta-Purpureofilum_apyrenoidigerum.ctg3155.p2 GENE.Plantae.Rhodophyta-Purpureofilum_apyrenoidigerum.ctg3155~~Plantae.Rhodophyta-Purpureofilum_apyrenoidigerum.ctg3155.p2  ORF type:complete len:502 (+),score=81.86 Plantae.Rhodophyta-Purpureofilum_apyrenoidigerum.ctg3155:102-1607(+)